MRAFRLAYDGRPFRGFQRQSHGDTVEDALFDALDALNVFARDGGDACSDANVDDLTPRPGRPPGYAAAGRTDAGVSAVAQTVGFVAPEWLTPEVLNTELPDAVRAWARADVDSEFHATHDATRREYTYFLYAPTGTDTLSVRTPIDDDRVRRALDRLSGRHDFHNLTPETTDTVRTLTASARRDGPFLILRVGAAGFPRQFVRRLVTLLHRIGVGDAEVAFVDRVLASEPLPGADGIGPAPAEPLVLSDVVYPHLAFEADSDVVEDVRAEFAARRVRALTNAAVAGAVAAGIGAASDDGNGLHPEDTERPPDD